MRLYAVTLLLALAGLGFGAHATLDYVEGFRVAAAGLECPR